MCNSLHSDSKPIRRRGAGWKIFHARGYELCSFIDLLPYQTTDVKRKSCSWNKPWSCDNDRPSDGFCFFTSKKIANKAKDYFYGGSIVVKIKYKGGLGKHIEKHFVSGELIPIALCKEFSIDDKKYVLAKSKLC